MVANRIARRSRGDLIAASGNLPPYFWAAFVLSGDWR
jgi:CHAT domain-containing protein